MKEVIEALFRFIESQHETLIESRFGDYRQCVLCCEEVGGTIKNGGHTDYCELGKISKMLDDLP